MPTSLHLENSISRNENTSVGVPCKDREWAATLEGAPRSTCAETLHECGKRRWGAGPTVQKAERGSSVLR